MHTRARAHTQAEYGDGATVIGDVAKGQRRLRSVNMSENGQVDRRRLMMCAFGRLIITAELKMVSDSVIIGPSPVRGIPESISSLNSRENLRIAGRGGQNRASRRKSRGDQREMMKRGW